MDGCIPGPIAISSPLDSSVGDSFSESWANDVVFFVFFNILCYFSLSFLSDGEARDASMLPVPDFQTKVPLYGRDHINSRKVQAMKQAKDRKKQLARLGTGNLDFSPLSVDKLEPDFVSEFGVRQVKAFWRG